MSENPQENFEVIIQPNKRWFYIDWRGLLHYQDLLFLLVRRDFVAKYKQTILGPLWFILQPLLTTLVFTIIFGHVTKIPTNGLPPTLFYLCGLLPWSYFSQCLTGVSDSLISNAQIFRKVYFPRLIVPLSVVMSNLMTFALQLVTFLGFYFYFKFFTPAGTSIHPHPFLIMLPLLLLQIAAISLGVGLWIAALTVKYRDFHHLVGFVAQLWMYATPIIYPISVIPKAWRFVMALNPMAGIVEAYRYAFFGKGFVDLDYLWVSGLGTFVVLVSGVLIFNKVERTFVDTI